MGIRGQARGYRGSSAAAQKLKEPSGQSSLGITKRSQALISSTGPKRFVGVGSDVENMGEKAAVIGHQWRVQLTSPTRKPGHCPIPMRERAPLRCPVNQSALTERYEAFLDGGDRLGGIGRNHPRRKHIVPGAITGMANESSVPHLWSSCMRHCGDKDHFTAALWTRRSHYRQILGRSA